LRKSFAVKLATMGGILLAASVWTTDAGAADESVGSSCPALSYLEGARIAAQFARSHSPDVVLPFGRRALIVGRLLDSDGFGLPGETLCVEERPRIPGQPYNMIGSTITRADGGWSFKLPSGPSRAIRVDYGGDPDLISTFLDVGVRAHATLHLRRHRTRARHRLYFSGRIGGPVPGKRVVILRGGRPGVKRKPLVRRARTDTFGHFRIPYAFGPRAGVGRFVFWVVVPEQDAYPYMLGRSPKRFVRVHR
jgi:hypothetical protein